MGYVINIIKWLLLSLLFWYPVVCSSSLCNSFEDRAPADEIYTFYYFISLPTLKHLYYRCLRVGKEIICSTANHLIIKFFTYNMSRAIRAGPIYKHDIYCELFKPMITPWFGDYTSNVAGPFATMASNTNANLTS